ncbi:MAG: hypothetical protein ACU84H_12365 [Gammaproteobacteria bacterium]
MWFLARFAAVAVLVWFYLTAKKKNQPPVKWAIIGFIGYWLTWGLVNLTLVKAMAAIIPSSFTMAFLVNQIPALAAICASYFIRKKLISDADAAAGEN